MNYIYLIIHISIIYFSLCVFLLPANRSVFGIIECNLLIDKYLINSKSLLNALFLKKSRLKNYLHLKQNVVIVVSFWAYFIVNTIICSFLWFYSISYLKIIFFLLVVIYMAIALVTNLMLKSKDEELELIEEKMSIAEQKEIIKDIEKKVPDFFK